MRIDFSAEYSERNDDELLHLASARHSLTPEAGAALDAELRRRNLTDADRIEHGRFVKRQEQREAKKHQRKTFGPFKYQLSWSEILLSFAVMALISFSYLALPSRYHLKPDQQDAAFIVMATSVLIAIACRDIFRRRFTCWISLAISSAIDFVIVHAWTQRVPILSHGTGRAAAVLGFLLFVAIYGLLGLLQRKLYGEDADDHTSNERQVSSSG
jgi:hypothetical protein